MDRRRDKRTLTVQLSVRIDLLLARGPPRRRSAPAHLAALLNILILELLTLMVRDELCRRLCHGSHLCRGSHPYHWSRLWRGSHLHDDDGMFGRPTSGYVDGMFGRPTSGFRRKGWNGNCRRRRFYFRRWFGNASTRRRRNKRLRALVLALRLITDSCTGCSLRNKRFYVAYD